MLRLSIPILVVNNGEHERVDEDKRYNQVIEPGPARQPNDFAAEPTLTFEHAAASSVVYYKFLVQFWKVKVCSFNIDVVHSVGVTLHVGVPFLV